MGEWANNGEGMEVDGGSSDEASSGFDINQILYIPCVVIVGVVVVVVVAFTKLLHI